MKLPLPIGLIGTGDSLAHSMNPVEETKVRPEGIRKESKGVHSALEKNFELLSLRERFSGSGAHIGRVQYSAHNLNDADSSSKALRVLRYASTHVAAC